MRGLCCRRFAVPIKRLESIARSHTRSNLCKMASLPFNRQMEPISGWFASALALALTLPIALRSLP